MIRLEKDQPEAPMWGSLRLPRTFAALRHRNFRLFYFGQLLSLVGTWMQDTARSWLVVLLALPAGATLAQVAHSPTSGPAADQANLYLSLIATASNLPVLFGSLYGGILADRYSKRSIIIWAQIGQMVLAFALAALVFTGHVALWQVVLLGALFGVTNIFDIPARQSFLVEMVGREDLPNAIALQSSIFNGARAIGPAVAGILIAALQNARSPLMGLGQCFFWNGVSYLFVIAGLRMMRGDFSPKGSGGGSPLDALREVRAFLLAKRPALLLVSLVAVFSLCNAPYFVLLPSLARFTLGVDAGRFGLLMSCQGIGALVAALMMATLSGYQRKGRILTAASLALPILTLLLAGTRSFPLACLLVLLTGFAIISFLATANALLQTSTPDTLRGRVMSLYSLILVGLTPVGSLWSGAIAKVYGAPGAIALGSVVILAAALTVALRFPSLRRAGATLP